MSGKRREVPGLRDTQAVVVAQFGTLSVAMLLTLYVCLSIFKDI